MDPSTIVAGEVRRAAAFPSTHWTAILQAADRESPEGNTALSRLCAAYWYPLYAFARSSGVPREEAEDAVQSFFARLVEKNTIEGITREGGKFRSFLLAALKNFIRSDWKKAHAEKRGGRGVHVPLEGSDSEARYQLEAKGEAAPDAVFERSWATAILESALAELEEECRQSKKGPLFAELQPFLTGADRAIPYSVAAKNLGISEESVKVAVHRLRRRYGEMLRSEIARTVNDPAEIEGEIQALIAAASRR